MAIIMSFRKDSWVRIAALVLRAQPPYARQNTYDPAISRCFSAEDSVYRKYRIIFMPIKPFVWWRQDIGVAVLVS